MHLAFNLGQAASRPVDQVSSADRFVEQMRLKWIFNASLVGGLNRSATPADRTGFLKNIFHLFSLLLNLTKDLVTKLQSAN